MEDKTTRLARSRRRAHIHAALAAELTGIDFEKPVGKGSENRHAEAEACLLYADAGLQSLCTGNHEYVSTHSEERFLSFDASQETQQSLTARRIPPERFKVAQNPERTLDCQEGLH